MKRLIAWHYKVPFLIKDMWYNASVYTKTGIYPVIFDKDKNYIECKMGLITEVMNVKEGYCVYYEVIKTRRTSGGDFLYSSDAINCNLKFSHIKSKEDKP